jgi:hypothetical protein
MPIVVPDSLADLRGPGGGIVTLPIWLDWGPRRTYDLARWGDLQTMYRTVITQAVTDAAVCDWLNAELLRRSWRRLSLTPYYREPWERRLPELAADGAH